MIKIDVSYDHVTINGVKVPCPSSVSASQWVAFWEEASQLKRVKDREYANGYADATGDCDDED